MTTAPSSSASVALPFDLRVHSLEARVFGIDHSGHASGSRPTERSIQRRIEDIEEALERAAQGSEALKRLIDGCELLIPQAPSDGSRADQVRSAVPTTLDAT